MFALHAKLGRILRASEASKNMPKLVANKESPHMTPLFKKAFERASEELHDYEQDILAQWLLDVIESEERRWDTALNNPSDNNPLNKLVNEALADIREGRTEPLDPNKL
jgi:hypothetical protein